ncbi:hypothetical protein EXS71_04090 [Candidatus Uhrbacteria bacterium]|nr:hypothetical protein [Candidatus Uhrbacteria bacterium]
MRLIGLSLFVLASGCQSDPSVIEKIVLEPCNADNPCLSGATCREDGLCYIVQQMPTPARECVVRLKYTITDRQDRKIEEGFITRNIDCCNSNDDCLNSAFGRHCVAQPMHVKDLIVDPAPGFTGFCQWCDRDKQIGCPLELVCYWGAENLLPFTGSDRLLIENLGGYGGAPSRSVYSCETPDLCGNGRRDGTETDVDCGTHGYYLGKYDYGCDQCRLGKQCVDDVDCESHWCKHGVCAACRNDDDCRVDYACKAGTCVK